MKRILIAATAVLLGTWAPAWAQTEGDLNRQMEVTREYEPTVNEAAKINIKPNMTDTVALRPELKYGIQTRPIGYGFDVTPIKPASISLDMYRQLTPLYIKAGLGFPFQSLLDVYYNSTQKTDGKFAAYLNHYGSWSKIKNDMDIKTPASQTFNKIGVLGEHRFGRLSVDGEAGFDYDKVSKYGYYFYDSPFPNDMETPTADDLRQNYSTVRGKISFGNAFEDLSYFNFRLGLDAAYFASRYKFNETDFSGYLDLGKTFGGKHEITLRAKYQGYFGMQELDAYKDHMVSVTPMYRLLGEKIKFKLGGTFTYDKLDIGGGNGESKGHFFPLVELKLDIANGYFTPYLEVDGQLSNNGYRSSVMRNPYVVNGLFDFNTEEYNGRVGIMGSISSSFSYKVYGGVSRYNYMQLYANLYTDVSNWGDWASNEFITLPDDVTMWTVGGDIEGRISGAFGIEAAVQYTHYKTREGLESGLPSITASLALKYSYRDKLIVTLGGDLYGNRKFNNVLFDAGYTLLESNSVNTMVDLHLGGQYNLSKKIGIFLDLNNLLNQKLYLYNRYPALGLNAMAGVKLSF